MTTSLVILAAGMGSRFGGPKQLAPLGPSGENLMDYAAFDALRAGFDELVVVTRAELEADVRAAFARGVGTRAPVRYVLQRLDDLPAGTHASASRTKPWGTGQAVLAAKRAVRGPFAVVNADDFYGSRSYELAAAFLRSVSAADVPPTYAVVGFPLGETLSERGAVTRARLDTTDGEWLAHVEELRGIASHGGEPRIGDRRLPPDQLVSMNMWAFTPALFPALRSAFADFVHAHGDDPSAEFLLPTFVEGLIGAGEARVRVIAGGGPWVGVTHPDDAPHVREAIARWVAAGAYPTPLWGG